MMFNFHCRTTLSTITSRSYNSKVTTGLNTIFLDLYFKKTKYDIERGFFKGSILFCFQVFFYFLCSKLFNLNVQDSILSWTNVRILLTLPHGNFPWRPPLVSMSLNSTVCILLSTEFHVGNQPYYF